MLYNGNADSLPLKTIPLYISRTDKEGRFTLRNLAKGSYKIFALKDANTNFRFDQPTESIAFLDSLITPTVILNPVDTTKPATDSLRVTRDSLPATKDSLPVKKDSLPQKSLYRYLPDSLELRLFTENRSNPYFSGSDRSRRDQFRLKFNEKIDSLDMEFLNLPLDSLAVSLEWTGDSDTIDFWIMNKEMASRDSMTAILSYPGYDSLESPIRKTDTTKLRYRPAAPSGKAGTAQKKEFSVTSSIDKTKTLEFNDPVIFTATLPFVKIDTSLIRLTTGKDSVGRRLEYKLFADTLKGLVLNGLPINQTHPRIVKMAAGLSADSLYRLTLLPGAFTGINGQKSDTLDIRFKMKNQDQYGSVILSLPDLREPAIIELLDSKNKVVSRRFMSSQGTTGFHLLPPGKYSARLIFDTNNNHRWDTGRYGTHVQPERVISFSKELNLKANWEMSETWQW
ncbi:MAG: hypothetical protein PHY99_00580 [Bacteroidales bacterium]|nr:hypothetical protein [Bacteroidales bacterium]